ncbi:nuclear transport factor 2 family protein [Kribbella sp. DT2]|uniref:nuclear transport factor 2 family protein n=1 Tax=Kribbella sp. DT2 TaxID=3393427 RepID=UPI003CE8B8A5
MPVRRCRPVADRDADLGVGVPAQPLPVQCALVDGGLQRRSQPLGWNLLLEEAIAFVVVQDDAREVTGVDLAPSELGPSGSGRRTDRQRLDTLEEEHDRGVRVQQPLDPLRDLLRGPGTVRGKSEHCHVTLATQLLHPVRDRIERNSQLASYAFLVDDGEFTGLGALLADADFTLNGATNHGSDAIEKFAGETLQVHSDGTPRTRHVSTNLIVEVDDEAGVATSRSYFTVFQALDDFPLQPIAAGRYRDRFERREGQWRFTHRDVTTDFHGDTSHHVKPRPDAS